MAKKKDITTFSGEMPEDFQEFLQDPHNAKMMLMMAAAEIGITPLEYSVFLQAYNSGGRERLTGGNDHLFSHSEEEFFPAFSSFGNDRRYLAEEVTAIPEAGKKTLRLRIQLRDVTKPPTWREVEVPADYNFNQLNAVIQTVMGWENCHLWQFQRKPYDSSLEIGISKKSPYGFGIENATHEADTTPITGFLKEKGSKLLYVYDFGDDWLHDVSVLAVEDKITSFPVLLKWKGLNGIEGCGGVFAYMTYRDIYTETSTLSKKEQKEFLNRLDFKSLKEFKKFMDNYIPDVEFINKRLKDTLNPINPE